MVIFTQIHHLLTHAIKLTSLKICQNKIGAFQLNTQISIWAISQLFGMDGGCYYCGWNANYPNIYNGYEVYPTLISQVDLTDNYLNIIKF